MRVGIGRLERHGGVAQARVAWRVYTANGGVDLVRVQGDLERRSTLPSIIVTDTSQQSDTGIAVIDTSNDTAVYRDTAVTTTWPDTATTGDTGVLIVAPGGSTRVGSKSAAKSLGNEKLGSEKEYPVTRSSTAPSLTSENTAVAVSPTIVVAKLAQVWAATAGDQSDSPPAHRVAKAT